MQPIEIIGQIVVEAMTAAIGISMGMTQFGASSNDEGMSEEKDPQKGKVEARVLGYEKP